MARLLTTLVFLGAITNIVKGVSTKMDFGGEEDTFSDVIINNVTKTTEEDDVEVKHTIVVSTKLKNNNRRGIHASSDDDGVLTFKSGQGINRKKDDSGEVPVIGGYKAVETTKIRSMDTRHKQKLYPDSVFVSRNIRDDNDYYPNVALNPSQWKPSSFFNNINWWNENGRNNYDISRRNEARLYDNPTQRKISEDSVREFYCKKCREMSGSKGCVPVH